MLPVLRHSAVRAVFRKHIPPALYDCRQRSTLATSKLIQVAEEVEDAIQTGKPVVALETTIYTHGFPYPENVALASHLESLVRVNGGVPATIGILNGIARVGMGPEQLIELISTAGSKDTWKVSRRDIGFNIGYGLRGKKLNGGTTISGTMVLAHLAGIKIFATGGLGGVHRGGENSMDISADLTELGRTPVAVVSSGCKSFLDISRTLEYLETQGVGVGTFADGRSGEVDFPGFFSRDSGTKSPQTIPSEEDAAAMIHAQFNHLNLQSGLLFGNPVPEKSAMARSEIETIIERAVAEATEQGYHGNRNTPYVLKRIRELSNNATVGANKALVEANVIRGTKVAVELAVLENAETDGAEKGTCQVLVPELPINTTTPSGDISKAPAETAEPPNVAQESDILVIGALAADTSCDYAPLDPASTSTAPIPHTSNPAKISQSSGGVGRNVATAAQYAGAQVSLASIVADDIAGKALFKQLTETGINTFNLRVLDTTTGARTAQYVAINDRNKDLVFAMGDFSIFSHPEFESASYWSDLVASQTPKPKSIVIDGNWSTNIISHILTAAKGSSIPVAFEPVSTVKAARLFGHTNTSITGTSVLPNNLTSLATPNKLELTAMHIAASYRELFTSDPWWRTLDSFGLSPSGSRERFVHTLGPQLVDEGIPQQIIQLLPYIPNMIVKLGAQGSLLAMVLRRGDPRLTSPESAPWILSRTNYQAGVVGGVYMRLFPPAEVVRPEDVVSVNGVGDTLLGVLMAGIVKQRKQGRDIRLEEILPRAQQAAVMTLKSSESVSPEIRRLVGVVKDIA